MVVGWDEKLDEHQSGETGHASQLCGADQSPRASHPVPSSCIEDNSTRPLLSTTLLWEDITFLTSPQKCFEMAKSAIIVYYLNIY